MEGADTPDLSAARANALIAYYGSERKAASAVGVPRSTLHHIAHGQAVARPSTAARVASGLAPGAAPIVTAIEGLVRTMGGTPDRQRAAAAQLARQDAARPGVLRDRALRFEARMRSQGLDPLGNPIRLPERDTLDRPILNSQERAYRALAADYADYLLDELDYERWIAYQTGSPSGGTDIEIAEL